MSDMPEVMNEDGIVMPESVKVKATRYPGHVELSVSDFGSHQYTRQDIVDDLTKQLGHLKADNAMLLAAHDAAAFVAALPPQEDS